MPAQSLWRQIIPDGQSRTHRPVSHWLPVTVEKHRYSPAESQFIRSAV
jgi:hypothetical protein